MNTVSTILYVIVMIVTAIFVFGIFVQTGKELQEKVGKEVINDIISWFKHTTLGMWYFNRKNKVEILSDEEYQMLLESGKIKSIEIEVE